MDFYIKKATDKSMKFRPHMNDALGKYYHTKEDYLSDMKKGGFEPYTGEAKAPTRQKPDMRGTNDVLKAIERCSNKDGSFSPGTKLKEELMKRGVIASKESFERYKNKVEEFKRG